MRSRSRTFYAFLATLLLLVLTAVPVLAGSTTWKLESFNASGRALRAQVVDVAPDGTASFTFPTTPDAAYLTSAKVPPLSLSALSATIGITTTGSTTFEYYPNGTPAMVGLYFQGRSSGGFDPSDYWWSGSSRITLASLVGNPTIISAALSDPSLWTNFYGQSGSQTGPYVVNGVTYPSAADGFAAAVASMKSWGVSFGGGSFYANGVGTPSGSAVFTLKP